MRPGTGVVAFLVLACAPALAAAAPSMSRGEQFLPIGYDACMDRARGAFQSLGWTNIGAGGAYVSAFRGGEGAYITCNEMVPGRVVVNVFVASDSSDSGVPGAAREQLQAAMGGATASTGPGPSGGCGWVNGFDQAVAGDTGRGITDPAPHRRHVLANGAGVVPGLIANRLAILRGCLSREAYARLYADASVLMASYGRDRLGWVDGMDGRAPADPGRGVSSWQAHYDYAAGGGAGQVPATFRDRLAAFSAAAPLDAAAQLYGDLSALIARHALGG